MASSQARHSARLCGWTWARPSALDDTIGVSHAPSKLVVVEGEQRLTLASKADWEAWLEQHADTASGALVRFARKSSRIESITHPEALEVALCWGWIDAQKAKSADPHFWEQRFAPRGPRSKWSRVNRDSCIRLIESGQMRPRGRAEVERAMTDGRWEAAYEPPSTITVPDDLAAELERRPRAAAFFATLDGRNRYAILYRLQDAKRPETRARRLEKFVAMLEAGEKLHP